MFSRDDARRHAEQLHGLIEDWAPGARTLLDIACGTGWHLERLRDWYAVEGPDLSPGMLRQARRRLPDVPFHRADMRSFDLGQAFDVVICLSSNIAWMQTRNDLFDAVTSMAGHAAEGGLVIIEPWDFPEDASDEPWLTTVVAPGKAVAVLEATTLQGNMWQEETHYLRWSRGGGIDHLVESHALGAFTQRQITKRPSLKQGSWCTSTRKGLLGRGLFIGTRRGS